MAIPWIALLKTVPWTEVIANAPAVTNGAKKLWSTVSGKPGQAEIARPSSSSGPQAGSMADLQADVDALRKVAADLHQQMLASSSLIQELAEQNSALIARLEAYRVRLFWLSVAVVLVGAVAVAALAMAMMV